MRIAKLDSVETWGEGPAEPPPESLLRIAADGRLEVPERPAIGCIAGDGIGPEIMPAMVHVVDTACRLAYGSTRALRWIELLAGTEAERRSGSALPDATLASLRQLIVSIKGPLATPVGQGRRSLNAALRQSLDFYSAIRPVAWLGQPAVLPRPERMSCTVFRENSDDVYVGVEFEAGQSSTHRLLRFLREEMGAPAAALPDDCGVTIKPMSEFKTKRHVRKALRWALERGLQRVVLAGKGNILKATEGAFLRWGVEVAREPEFRDRVVTEGAAGEGQIRLGTIITDQMLMQLVLSPESYDVIVTQNLNGDYISDLAAALVGGPGFVPSGNVGDGCALFESTHGTARGKAGKNTANPTSLILSGAMLLDYLGWREAADLVTRAVRLAFADRLGTPDVTRAYPEQAAAPRGLSTWEFACAVAERCDPGR